MTTFKATLSGRMPVVERSSSGISSKRDGSLVDSSAVPDATSSRPSRSALTESSLIRISTVSLAKSMLPLSLLTWISRPADPRASFTSATRSSTPVLALPSVPSVSALAMLTHTVTVLSSLSVVITSRVTSSARMPVVGMAFSAASSYWEASRDASASLPMDTAVRPRRSAFAEVPKMVKS